MRRSLTRQMWVWICFVRFQLHVCFLLSLFLLWFVLCASLSPFVFCLSNVQWRLNRQPSTGSNSSSLRIRSNSLSHNFDRFRIANQRLSKPFSRNFGEPQHDSGGERTSTLPLSSSIHDLRYGSSQRSRRYPECAPHHVPQVNSSRSSFFVCQRHILSMIANIRSAFLGTADAERKQWMLELQSASSLARQTI